MTEVLPSPNIWRTPETYELENLAVDRDGVVEAAIRSVADWVGRDLVDIGCGTGFHLPRFAATARSVVGVEPHQPLYARACERVSGLPGVSVVLGSASGTQLPAASIDVAHARWAYFFGAGCEPGLAELARILRPGGTAFVVDVDATRSTFGTWFRRAWPAYDPPAVERFWRRQGWSRVRLDIGWTFEDPADFARVLRIELPPPVCEAVLAEDPRRTTVDYAVNLWWRRF